MGTFFHLLLDDADDDDENKLELPFHSSSQCLVNIDSWWLIDGWWSMVDALRVMVDALWVTLTVGSLLRIRVLKKDTPGCTKNILDILVHTGNPLAH